ncbi:MAG: B12-binding domain-containing protein, partial [Gammaproteobacteria bacterium]
MKLSPVPTAAMELEQHAHEISAAAAAHLLEHNPKIAARFGDDARSIWTEHLRQRVLELCAAMASGEVDLFVSCVTWSRTAMQARDVEASDLDASLTSLRIAVEPRLGSAPQEVVATCIDAAIAAVGREPKEFANSTLDAGLMTGRIALRYIQAVIAGNAIPGMSIVLDAVDEGLGVPEAIFNVLLPAQREVGRLWHVNDIS